MPITVTTTIAMGEVMVGGEVIPVITITHTTLISTRTIARTTGITVRIHTRITTATEITATGIMDIISNIS